MSHKVQIKEVTSQILTTVTRNRVCWIHESLDTDFKRRILTAVMYMSLYRLTGFASPRKKTAVTTLPK